MSRIAPRRSGFRRALPEHHDGRRVVFPRIPLPHGWTDSVRRAVLHVIALAQYSLVSARSWAADCRSARVRLQAEVDRLRQELALLGEQQRIKDARMARIDPHRRPHYPPCERVAILELKAARGWSLDQTARAFHVTPATIALWMKRLDEEGPDALVQIRQPVNRFPEMVAYMVQRLRTLCPRMGTRKIAERLTRAGLHLGATTVGRMLKRKPRHRPATPIEDASDEPARRVVTAKYPNHVWHVDLTVVPTGGFWTSWLPLALPQRWPFCWWVVVAIDHFSRRAMGAASFRTQPTSEQVRAVLGRAITHSGTPKYLVCDRGGQFDCDGFRAWCRRKRIKPPRYGAVGKHGSIAVVERFILTLNTLLGCLLLVPYRRESSRRELGAIVRWYNAHGPHAWLGGRTPDEVYFDRYSAHRRPRLQPRADWPRGSPCARPRALVRGRPGARVKLDVSFLGGRKHLPVVTARRAA
jgi:transposase InsO family protein